MLKLVYSKLKSKKSGTNMAQILKPLISNSSCNNQDTQTTIQNKIKRASLWLPMHSQPMPPVGRAAEIPQKRN